MSRKNKKLVTSLLSLIVLIAVVSYQYILPSYAYKDNSNNTSDVISIPSYDNEPYKEVNNNKPTFTDSEKKLTEREDYSAQSRNHQGFIDRNLRTVLYFYW